MRSCIYGAGSLGTVLGAYITKNGGQIDLINRNRAHVEALRTKGAHVTGTTEMTVPVKALTPDEMTGKYDLIILLTKQIDNVETLTALKPYMSEDCTVCTLQNGFVFNDLLTNYERVGDHCSNVAVAMIELAEDVFDTHEYLDSLKNIKDAAFAQSFEEFRQKYSI